MQHTDPHNSSALENLGQALQALDFRLTYAPASRDLPQEQLLLIAGRNAAGQSLMLKMHWAESSSWGEILCFTVRLPATIYSEQVLDLSRLTTVLNRRLPLGAFAVSREQGLAFYYQLMGPDAFFAPELVAEIVRDIAAILEQTESFFEAYLQRRCALLDLLQELGVSA